MPGAQAATASAALPSQTIFSHATAIEAGSHTAILQSLDRKVGGVCLRADQFEKSVEAWAGIPVIFAQEHPDLDAYDADPEAELKRIGGRLLGEVSDPRIETAGHKKLVGELGFGGDEEVEQLCATSKLGGSTAFRTAPITNATITSPPRPHHVLVFRWTPDGGTQPVDPGMWILNAAASPMDLSHTGREFSAKNIAKLRGLFEQIRDLLGGDEPEPIANAEPVQDPAPAPDPEPTQDTDMNETEVATAITNAVAEKEAALTNALAENATLRAKLDQVEKERKDAEWADVKNAVIPEGWTDTPEKEAEIRDEAENRPLAFAKRIAAIPRPDLKKTREEGAEFAHAAPAADDGAANARELRKNTGRK